MERLRFEKCKKCDIWNGSILHCMDMCMKPFYALEEFNRYKDLEEQGLLHKAPLKNGTPIWYFVYGFDEETYLLSTTYLFGITEYEIGELGKEFWLSEEEAEAKLKEMEGES